VFVSSKKSWTSEQIMVEIYRRNNSLVWLSSKIGIGATTVKYHLHWLHAKWTSIEVQCSWARWVVVPTNVYNPSNKMKEGKRT
jgi:hypothetical protein